MDLNKKCRLKHDRLRQPILGSERDFDVPLRGCLECHWSVTGLIRLLFLGHSNCQRAVKMDGGSGQKFEIAALQTARAERGVYNLEEHGG
jgi:hypothetical protein